MIATNSSILVEQCVDLGLEVFPHNTEHDTLETVGNDPCLQTAAEQAHHTVLCYDIFDGCGVGYDFGVRLAVGFDDADGVGGGIEAQQFNLLQQLCSRR